MRRLRYLLTVQLLAALSPAANGKPPPATRVDAHGDPLPAHAVGRLGSTRFRHDLNPWDIVYSPDGKLLASWTDEPGVIHVWDAETGKSLHRFARPDGSLYPRIGFTNDSEHFGGYQSVWDLSTGKEVLKLDGDFRAFSEDGPRVASLNWKKTEIWDLPNRKKLRDFPGQFIALSKDGKRLTTVVENKAVVWDVESGKELQQLAGKIINHSSGQLLAWTDEKDLRLWDTSANKETARLPEVLDLEMRIPFPRHSFSGDGKKFAGFQMKDSLEKATIWDTATGKPVGELAAPRRRLFLGIALSPDGKTAATVNDSPGMLTSIYVWDAITGKQLHGKIEGVRAVFSPDGKRIASADGAVIRTWDAATGQEKTPAPGPTGGVLCVSFSADGRSVVAGYDNVDASTFRTWDVESGKVVRAFGPNPQRNLSGLTNKKAIFSADGKLIFAVHSQRLLVLNVSTGRATELSDVRENSVRWLSVRPDGKNVAALEMRQVNKNDLVLERPKCEAVFRFLDGSTGRDLPEKDRPRWAAALQRLAPEPGPNTIAFATSTDFRILAWVRLNSFDEGEPKDLRLREIATGKDLPPVRLRSMIRGLALSPDGRLLAVVTADRRLVFWDTATATEVASRTTSQTRPKCIAFGPDGKSVVVGCADSTILLYEVPGPPEPAPVAASELERLWSDLAGADATIAYRAVARLRADPKSAVKLFEQRLRPVTKDASAEATALVADLDSPAFAKREAASAAIAKLGQDTIAALRSALAKNPGPEHRERLEKALADVTRQVTASEDARRLRALQVLEQIGDAPALAVLKKMSDGPDEAWVTQEARESVSRLSNRP